jgi:hypothetical protein
LVYLEVADEFKPTIVPVPVEVEPSEKVRVNAYAYVSPGAGSVKEMVKVLPDGTNVGGLGKETGPPVSVRMIWVRATDVGMSFDPM